eukprot:m.45896 g.45896  ORF g.45896 m.45896 type:complete len:674 (-) comp10308_c0_seq1:1227-3248(-)
MAPLLDFQMGSLAAVAVLLYNYGDFCSQYLPFFEKVQESCALKCTSCLAIGLFVHFYHLGKQALFLFTMGIISYGMAKDIPAALYVGHALLGIGFVLQFPGMPGRCKIYTGAFTGIAMYTGYSTVLVHFIYLIGFRRLLILLMTMKSSFPASYFFTTISNIFPAYYFSRHDFFRADSPPEHIALKREAAFDALQAKWNKKWPKSLALSAELRESFSDLRFAAGNRVFLPFKKILDEWCDPFTISVATDRMNLIDLDGHEQLDIAGSYGVNVAGYDRYKKWISEGWNEVAGLGCVLGPVHPILAENVRMLKSISGQSEVSFHMSGTEAVMSAARLARFNTKKNFIAVFGGAYHGWWDGVQSTAGNERVAEDVLTLTDMADSSLRILKLRCNEIAAVLVNPLQAFHANSPPPSDLVLATDNRKCGEDKAKYTAWLIKLQRVCRDYGIVLIFDEVYTGFRLAPGGAQEYFDIKADMVCYGKTLGGGIANGVVCGPSWLMARCDPDRPLRLAYVIGTFAAHPLLLGAMNKFLKWVTTSEAQKVYQDMHTRVLKFVIDTNKALEENDIPLRCASYSTVWTMLFQTPGRYHWILQYYLKDEGINLSWVGTGRLNFSLDFEDEDLVLVRERLIRACLRMKDDGWWFYDPKKQVSNVMIKLKLAKEIVAALVRGCFRKIAA